MRELNWPYRCRVKTKNKIQFYTFLFSKFCFSFPIILVTTSSQPSLSFFFSLYFIYFLLCVCVGGGGGGGKARFYFSIFFFILPRRIRIGHRIGLPIRTFDFFRAMEEETVHVEWIMTGDVESRKGLFAHTIESPDLFF